MLTKLDDYPIHQTTEPLAIVGTTDRHAYDRYWFNGYQDDGQMYFAIGAAVYPNLGILDCGFSIVIDGQQHAFHGSRRAPEERSEITVGPFTIEIIEPMKSLRVTLDDNDTGISADLLWIPRTASFAEEHQRTQRNPYGSRAHMEATRFNQFGRWQGEIRFPGGSVTLDPAHVYGTKDRSWGIRPVGDPAPPDGPPDSRYYDGAMTESRAAGARAKPGETPEDRALLERIQAGEAESFDAFVDRFGSMIWAFGLRMCGHKQDAEDVFQETLVKIFTSLKTLENPGALRTWIWRVVANECRMSRRGPRDPSRALGFDDLRRPGEDEGPAPDFEDEGSLSPEDAAIRGETRERVEEAVRNLPPQYRIIVLLRDFEGLSTEQVADVLEISTSNAKVRLHRARLALRKLLEEPAGGALDDA